MSSAFSMAKSKTSENSAAAADDVLSGFSPTYNTWSYNPGDRTLRSQRSGNLKPNTDLELLQPLFRTFIHFLDTTWKAAAAAAVTSFMELSFS
jgi:hypothetical protein